MVTIRDIQGYYNIGALIIRIRCWGPLYYQYNKEPQNSIGNCLGPDIKHDSGPEAKKESASATAHAAPKMNSNREYCQQKR